jgi:hypothetical protein
MNQSDLKEIADRFRKLPFAFLQEPEIDALADEIASARTIDDLGNVVAKLSMDIETHRNCDNWSKANHEENVMSDLLDWDGRLSLWEKTKLREIVHAKAKDFSNITSSSIALKIPAWDILLKERGVRRINHYDTLKEDEVGVDDPFGSHLVMTEETARKILVLGL